VAEQNMIKQQSSNLIGTAFILLVASMIIGQYFQDLSFYINSQSFDVKSSQDIKQVKSNSDVRVFLPLDFDQAIGISFLSDREFILTPFKGSSLSLIYVTEGPIVSGTEKLLDSPILGRAVKSDFADTWQVNGKSLKLKAIYQKQGMTLPDDAIVVYSAQKKMPSLWLSFIALISLIYILWQVKSLLLFISNFIQSKKG
jgi:hypothetical protein